MNPILAACILSWNPQPDATGFRVWRGLDCIATVETNRATVQLQTDQLSTLTVTATNEMGESEHSDPITAIPITPQTSENLTDWKPQKPFFIQAKPSLFFRFSYPSP
jgi:hypothetical protein